jgi:hypothetical protein
MIAVAPVTYGRIARRATRRRLAVLLVALFPLLRASNLRGEQPEPETPLRLIGATATVIEASSGLPFMARIDTGATTCSIHCEAIEIENASDIAKENIGKPIRFLVKNKKGQSEWLSAVVADYRIVRTSERTDWRYKVKLGLRWNDVEKSVLVTLNDRKHMKFPVLIGRNFLRNDFLVNVAWESSEAVAQIAGASKAADVDAAVPPNDTVAVNDAAAGRADKP